jgi:hypothetical protein
VTKQNIISSIINDNGVAFIILAARFPFLYERIFNQAAKHVGVVTVVHAPRGPTYPLSLFFLFVITVHMAVFFIFMAMLSFLFLVKQSRFSIMTTVVCPNGLLSIPSFCVACLSPDHQLQLDACLPLSENQMSF